MSERADLPDVPDAAVEAGAVAIWDALDRATCIGDNRDHHPFPTWGDRPDPPEDYDRWVEYASAHALKAALPVLVEQGWTPPDTEAR